MTVNTDKQYTCKILPEHQEFLTRLVENGVYRSKADAAYEAIALLMEKHPRESEGLNVRKVDRRTSPYR